MAIITNNMLNNGFHAYLHRSSKNDFEDDRCYVLIIDDYSKKVLVVRTSDKSIAFEIDMKDILVASCPNYMKKREEHHYFYIKMDNGEILDFYADTPYINDPVSFVNRLNRRVLSIKNPKCMVKISKVCTIMVALFSIVSTIYTIYNWINEAFIPICVLYTAISIFITIIAIFAFSKWGHNIWGD